MLYREAGDFKTSYTDDSQTFPIKFDRLRYYAVLVIFDHPAPAFPMPLKPDLPARPGASRARICLPPKSAQIMAKGATRPKSPQFLAFRPQGRFGEPITERL